MKNDKFKSFHNNHTSDDETQISLEEKLTFDNRSRNDVGETSTKIT